MNYIYCFTNLINNKKYIGSTIQQPNIRYNQHIYCAFHEESGRYEYPLYCAIRKYGKENFKYEILFSKECNEEEIRQIEKEYILKFNTLCPNGYNQTSNTKHPLNDIESYKKMSETKRNNAREIAEIDENKNKIKVYRSIIDCAEETGLDERKIAAVCRGERSTTKGRKFCFIENNELLIPEYKGDTYQGEKGTTQIQSTSRKIAKIDPETEEIICAYDTIALAARENNCDASGLSKACRGKRRISAGYKWKYIDN